MRVGGCAQPPCYFGCPLLLYFWTHRHLFSPIAGSNIKIRLKANEKQTILTPKYLRPHPQYLMPNPLLVAWHQIAGSETQEKACMKAKWCTSRLLPVGSITATRCFTVSSYGAKLQAMIRFAREEIDSIRCSQSAQWRSAMHCGVMVGRSSPKKISLGCPSDRQSQNFDLPRDLYKKLIRR